MNKKYISIPTAIYTIGDSFLFTHKEYGMIMEAIYSYFFGGENLETITDGMSKTLTDVTICLVGMMEADGYETC